MEQMRADRFLTETGYGTRSEAKKIIRDGRLTKNGTPVLRPEERIAPEEDHMALDGTPISFSPFEYWVINKPAGILSATQDRTRETVISYMGLKRKGLAPCGRLDIDTEGLLLVTNDGQLMHRLLAPGRHVDKRYEVWYTGTLPADAADRFLSGITLEDGTKCLPAELEKRGVPGSPLFVQKESPVFGQKKGTDAVTPEGEEERASSAASESRREYCGIPAVLRIQEGKFHEVKRMFRALGASVTHLRRISMGSLNLDALGLAPGDFRLLNSEEVRTLRAFSEHGEGSAIGVPTLPDINRFRAFLFDFDGTLVDSMWMWEAVDREYLARFGIREIPHKFITTKIAGMSLSETAALFKREFSIPDPPEKMIRDWEEMTVEKYRKEVPLKPGAAHFLTVIRNRGAKIAITSSNSRRMIEAAVESNHIRDMIDLVVTTDEVRAGKPDPAIYLEAARRLSVRPEDCLVFEDIPEGILAGKRAGMTVCAVKDAFSKKQEPVKKELAGCLIASYEELL